MDNVIVKVNSMEHSSEVVDWFRGRGVDTDGSKGYICAEDDYAGIYCGIIGGVFDFYHIPCGHLDVDIYEIPIKEESVIDNTVIWSKDPEHGKRVIEYFRSKGVATGGLSGKVRLCYYGVINGLFGEYSYLHVAHSTTGVKIIELPDEDTDYPKIMWVSQSDEDCKGKKQRVVFMEKNGRYIAWHCAETFKDAEKTTVTSAWKYAKDIEPLHLTMQDISDGKGVGYPVDKLRVKK